MIPRRADWMRPAQGFSPPAQGFSPLAQGFSPPAQGFSPQAQGFSPQAQGLPPRAQGSPPRAQGSPPRAQGSPPRAQGSPPGVARAAALAALAVAAGCAGDLRWPHIRTQRHPGPMPALVDPLPPGTEARHPRGPEEVLVIRHADPVQLRPAGQLSAFPLTFYEKSRRAHSGSWVYSMPGGRAEVLWPNGASLLLFGRCAGVVGSQSRGEPAFMLLEVERVDVSFLERDQIRLLGGSLLTVESGPFVVQRVREDMLRVKNQSKKAGEIAFRDQTFLLDPGEVIDLPLLGAGGAPEPGLPGGRTIEGPGFSVEVHGEVAELEDPAGVRLAADGEHRISGFGVRIELEDGEGVRLTGLRPGYVPRAAMRSAAALEESVTPPDDLRVAEDPAPEATPEATPEDEPEPEPEIEPEIEPDAPPEEEPEDQPIGRSR